MDKRRSRMHRTATNKKLEITERDLEIFNLLHRYRYLRSTFIHAFVGGRSETRFKERLGHLYHEGNYLNRPFQQWQYANARYMPVVYENGVGAEDALRRHGLINGETATWLQKGRMGAQRQFAHALLICDTLASIELGVRANPSLRFISWEEIIGKAPNRLRNAENPLRIPVSITNTRGGTRQHLETGIVPDGLFGLEYERPEGKAYRFFALEADRSSEPVSRTDLQQSSYLKKLLAYRQIVAQQTYKSYLGLPNLFVLTVTTNERHMSSIMALLENLASGGSTLFLFKTAPALGDFRRAPLPSHSMLVEAWQRVGHEPFLICR
jgi:hypothetical protein